MRRSFNSSNYQLDPCVSTPSHFSRSLQYKICSFIFNRAMNNFNVFAPHRTEYRNETVSSQAAIKSIVASQYMCKPIYVQAIKSICASQYHQHHWPLMWVDGPATVLPVRACQFHNLKVVSCNQNLPTRIWWPDYLAVSSKLILQEKLRLDFCCTFPQFHLNLDWPPKNGGWYLVRWTVKAT